MRILSVVGRQGVGKSCALELLLEFFGDEAVYYRIDHGDDMLLARISSWFDIGKRIILLDDVDHLSTSASAVLQDFLRNFQDCDSVLLVVSQEKTDSNWANHLCTIAEYVISSPNEEQRHQLLGNDDNLAAASTEKTILIQEGTSYASLIQSLREGEFRESRRSQDNAQLLSRTSKLPSFLTAAWEQIRPTIEELKICDDPEIAALRLAYRLRPCRGILISGRTGSGKSTLAHWLAIELQQRFRCINVSCADLVHKVVGKSEKAIAALFGKARELSPCLIILENIEMLVGVPREGSKHGHGRTTSAVVDRILSCFLIELDGVQSKHHQDVIVIATCLNRELLDRALVCSGRLEMHVDLDELNK